MRAGKIRDVLDSDRVVVVLLAVHKYTVDHLLRQTTLTNSGWLAIWLDLIFDQKTDGSTDDRRVKLASLLLPIITVAIHAVRMAPIILSPASSLCRRSIYMLCVHVMAAAMRALFTMAILIGVVWLWTATA